MEESRRERRREAILRLLAFCLHPFNSQKRKQLRRHRRISRLQEAADRRVRKRKRATAPAKSQRARILSAGAAKRFSINWVMGSEEGRGWAYSNNAERLSSHMPRQRHEVNGDDPADVAVFFDALIASRTQVEAKAKVLRVGGPRPLARLYADDEAMKSGLASFDAIIALSPALRARIAKYHDYVVFLPNGLDLSKWSPASRAPRSNSAFTAGFAASLMSKEERATKGFDLFRAACEKANVKPFYLEKGRLQLPHERMISDFYSQIDVLVHPVGPGREGTSNVIMEALAVGVPVITTRDAGFHGESLEAGLEAMICERDIESIADALAQLGSDNALRTRLAVEGRSFAVRHHDISVIAASYEQVLSDAQDRADIRLPRDITFIPFWSPVDQFASSRLRGKIAAEHANDPELGIHARLGTVPAFGPNIVIQSCHDKTLEHFAADERKILIYDVCDRYFEGSETFLVNGQKVDSKVRFNALLERAQVVIVPTQTLKAEISERYPEKPCFVVPEAIDYSSEVLPPKTDSSGPVLWFGNPNRGNFDSARWVLDRMRIHHQREVRLISKASFFVDDPAYSQLCEQWNSHDFLPRLRAACLTVVSHSEEEKTKSPNRLVTSIANGIPAIVSGSHTCAHLLEAAGCGFAVISDEKELDEAIARLSRPDERRKYIESAQSEVLKRHGRETVTNSYHDLLRFRTTTKTQGSTRVLLVSHNLQADEGAPRSLLQLATGLRDRYGLSVSVFACGDGPLRSELQDNGIDVAVHGLGSDQVVKWLNHDLVGVRESFVAALSENRVDVVIANTIKAAPFVSLAQSAGVPAVSIIRESYSPPERFEYFDPDIGQLAQKALVQAKAVVFVANSTRDLWRDQPMAPVVRVIPNGIDARPFQPWLSMSRQEARKRLGIAEDVFVGVCVGTINSRKGQLELLGALSGLPDDVAHKFRLVFVGAKFNSHLDQFQRSLQQLDQSLAERVQVVNSTPDVGLYYRAANVLLLNSRSESYPRVVMEGLMFGLPVISPECFGVVEQIEDGKSGLLFAPGDMPRWQEIVADLVRNPARADEMGKHAKQRFWSLPGYADMLHEYRCLIELTAEEVIAQPEHTLN